MEQTFLIAGNPSKLNIDLAHEALSRKHRVLVTLEPGTESPPIPAGLEKGLHYVEWNRRSPISARFVILQAMNKELNIDHAVILYTPQSEKAPMHDLGSATVEERLDFDCKGYFFLLKELIAYFLRKRSGTVTFLMHNTGSDDLQPVEAMLWGGFEALGSSLLSAYEQEGLAIRMVQTKLAQNRQIAEYVLQVCEENSPRTKGKLLKYTGKTGFFSFGR